MGGDLSPSAASSSRPRLFFALWPSAVFQAALAAATRDVVLACGGRCVPAANFHVTLAFLGSMAEHRIRALLAVARSVAHDSGSEHTGSDGALKSEAFGLGQCGVTLEFDRIEYWRKPRLLCATAGDKGESTGQRPESDVRQSGAGALARLLKSRLTAAGFSLDAKPFRAHVTLARKVMSGPESPSGAGSDELVMRPIRWTFTDFALVDSLTAPGGSLYSVLDSWPLCTKSAQKPGKKG